MPLLNLRSLCAFFDQRLPSVLKGGKDVVFHFIGNQSINWPLLVLKTVFKFFKLKKWATHDGPVAFVVDDTLVIKGSSLPLTHVVSSDFCGVSSYGRRGLSSGPSGTASSPWGGGMPFSYRSGAA
jgi:hypothetical protein